MVCGFSPGAKIDITRKNGDLKYRWKKCEQNVKNRLYQKAKNSQLPWPSVWEKPILF